jgi:hypothetical protein
MTHTHFYGCFSSHDMRRSKQSFYYISNNEQKLKSESNLIQMFKRMSINIDALLKTFRHRIINFLAQFRSNKFRDLLLYTISLRCPHKKKPVGVRSDYLAGQSITPRRPIHHDGNLPSRQSRTSEA